MEGLSEELHLAQSVRGYSEVRGYQRICTLRKAAQIQHSQRHMIVAKTALMSLGILPRPSSSATSGGAEVVCDVC